MPYRSIILKTHSTCKGRRGRKEMVLQFIHELEGEKEHKKAGVHSTAAQFRCLISPPLWPCGPV